MAFAAWIGSSTAIAQETCEGTRVGAPVPSYGFGDELAIDGDRMVVADDFLGVEAAAVYRLEEGVWTFEQSLTADDGGNVVGMKLAIDGTRIAMGTPSETVGGVALAGAVYVFDRIGTSWTQSAKLVANDALASDLLGRSVAVRGDWIVAGALRDPLGRAYVFRNAGGSWIQAQELDRPLAGAFGNFGIACDLSDDRLVIADNIADPGGAAFVYELVAGAWSSMQTIWPPAPSTDFQFGFNIDLDGHRLLVGARRNAVPPGPDPGTAHLFDEVAGVWQHSAELAGTVGNGSYGENVALLGDTAVVCDSTLGLHGPGFGAAFLFERVGSAWLQVDIVLPADFHSLGFYGTGVALSEDRLVIGSPQDDGFGVDAGALWSFARNCPAASPYGCLPADGTLTILGGTTSLSSTITVGVDDPFGASESGSAALAAIAAAPAATFPCGIPVPGLGMAQDVGEILVDLGSPPLALLVSGEIWTTPDSPVPIPIGIPSAPVLLGASFYLQALLAGPNELRVTGARRLKIGL